MVTFDYFIINLRLLRYQNREEDLPDGKRSIVEITSVQDADYGIYNCSVENGYGNDTITIFFSQKGMSIIQHCVCCMNRSIT